MNALIEEIMEELGYDIMQHGILRQLAEDSPGSPHWLDVLARLLSSGIAIGDTALAKDHVEFIAWRGTVDERLERARQQVVAASGMDEIYAYWICLGKNVDRMEP